MGGVLTTLKDFLTAWYTGRKQRTLDKARTKLLRQMLDARDWRKLSTLSRVIGADADNTKRLLIELGARGGDSGEAERSFRRELSMRFKQPHPR